MKVPKFIIENDMLIMGIVELHMDLVLTDDFSVKGGGWWHNDKENKIIYFYSKSYDYGRFNPEDLQKIFTNKSCRQSQKLKDYKWVYSTSESLEDAIKEGTELT